MIKNDIIFNTIDNGIIILDENLNILAWNYWLEIRTSIKQNEIINKNICEQFPYINEKKLKRKIKAVIVTSNPSFYNVDPHKFLIDIKTNSIVENVYKSMQQDITIVPYDIEKKQVCLYIYDKTALCKTNFKLEKLNDKLKDLSNRDPMTHAFNRRYFSEFSEKMLSLSVRNNQCVCLFILDIDKFKNINDNYGHSVGDKVIILLAQKLEEYVRTSDIVARFGGEEFVIFLHNTCIDIAEKIAEKIRKNIEDIVVDTENGELGFTVSIGVSQYDDEKDDNNIENTLKRADDSLYIAKKGGRNQVIISN
jgi:diguanylate cyclase (GGDEF)-like protein